VKGVRFLIFMLALVDLAALARGLAWEERQGYRQVKVAPAPGAKAGFTLLPGTTTGVNFSNTLSEERIMANANLLNGSGVALGDYDGDGLCDIYLCDLSGTNALFRNLGNWKFANVTASAGVACPGQTSTGAVFADVNGDGRLDLLVTSMGGPNALFMNQGDGRFTNVTAASGLTSRLGSSSMALADVDGNGTLDLYVANYGLTSLLRSGGALSFRMVNGKPVPTGRNARRIKVIDDVMYELGEPDAFYLNDGAGNFRAIPWTGGTFLQENGKPLEDVPWDQGLAAAFRDFNNDGAPDLYVSNDASTPDRFWMNDGAGRFRAVHALAQRQTSYFSMCADAADLDRDGQNEFFVVDMLSRDHRRVMTQMGSMHPQPRVIGESGNQPQVRRNTLFHAHGDGDYAEIAHFSGIAASEWSWGCTFLDVDLDGWEDLLIPNGFAYDMDDLDKRDHYATLGPLSIADSRRKILGYPRLETPNVAFRNQRDLTFREAGAEWGFASTQVSNGMAAGDLDNDGDLDLVINCFNAAALVYRNEASQPRVGVRLKGKAPNTQGIGAKIKVTGGPVVQTQEVIAGGRYVSGDDPMRVFAAGASTNLTIEVTWRTGKKSLLAAQPNVIYEIDETAARDAPPATKTAEPAPIFRDVSNLLNHTHHEEKFDDLARQTLLPRALSQPGPGVSWFDYDADGDDDLMVGSGRGGTLAIFQNDGKGAFQRLASPAIVSKTPDDLGAIVGVNLGSQHRSIVAAVGNYENFTNNPATLHYDVSGGTLSLGASLPPLESSSGALAFGDVDRDGQLDLFVGGRVLAGRYPEPASSRIFRSHQGRFQADEARSRPFANIGLVNGAVFTDVNGDSHSDLLIACEWGPIRVFLNDNGNLVEATEKLGLTKYVGWWNGVTTGDFDADGRMDIVASNWGRNTRYEQHRARPLRLYYGDLDDNGTHDLVEAWFNPAMNKVVPEQQFDLMSRGIPGLRERIRTHKAYAEAGVEDLFGASLQKAKVLEANWLESAVFLNRGDRFEAKPLPREAQFAPAFGVSVSDFDGDGNEDVFLAQNFFATLHDASRYDAGRGLLLRGDGTGNFISVPGQESGMKIYGEQRGCAVADFDRDGRADLVVTQNGAATKLFRNAGAKPGVRVRLKGGETNPDGIGAAVRLFFGEKAGPVREVRAGGGYWSQDSAVQVLAAPRTPTRVWIRWPGGKTAFKDIAPDAQELEIPVND
jgi:enediyne biosynthesis protein E4